MVVTVVACRCLNGKSNCIRDMLKAEGFTVRSQKVWRPGYLRVVVNGKIVWSWRLLRSFPLQEDLARLVRESLGM